MSDKNKNSSPSTLTHPLDACEIKIEQACDNWKTSVKMPATLTLDRVSPTDESQKSTTITIDKETMGYLFKQPDASLVISLDGLPAGSAPTFSATLSKRNVKH
jgi:hypothetical protein